MTAKFILHVGAPKTGTSYLERIIWSGQDRLLKDGIWMPGSTRRAHDALMGDVRGGIWHDPQHPWTWERLVASIHERDDVVLVSKEMFSGAPRPRIERAMAGLRDVEVHLVVTCRALSAALPSAWQQGVKANFKIAFGDWLEEIRSGRRPGFWRHHDPVSILDRWGAGIPRERLHVVTMPPSSADPTLLWKRFASVLGVDPGDYETPEKPANESLGAVEAEFLRRVVVELDDEFPMRWPWMQQVHQPLVRDVLLESPIVAAATRRKFGVPAAYQDWVIERSQELVDSLAGYGCSVVGDLADLEPRLDRHALSPDDVTDEELAAFGMKVAAQLLRNRAADKAAATAASGQ